jgi:hypothetical protein
MTNPFDTLKGLQDYNELNGLGIFKKLKKLGKKFDSVKRKIEKKITPKFLYNAKRKIKHAVIKSPLVQGVITGVVSIYGTPAAGMAVKAAMAAINARNKVRAARSEGKQAEEIAALEAESEKMLKEINSVTPEFGAMINTMQAQGYTDQQILDTWAQSQAFRDTATTAVAQNVMPQVKTQMQQSGYSPQMVEQVAPQVVSELTNEVIDQVVPNAKPKIDPAILLGAAGLLITLFKK